ncbi:MAG: hypothetical protein KF745_07060 [Phycisphaeraceae bacterium]|nr:hypothetical protein [Phycisphaeraceae bacterium]
MEPAPLNPDLPNRAAGDLLPLVYEQLRAIARQRMALERHAGAGHTLQPTALVHEAFARLSREADHPPGEPAAPATWHDHRQFFLAAAREMERVLVDHARIKFAAKRGGDPSQSGGWKRLPVDIIELAQPERGGDVLALRDALLRLEQEDPQAAAVVRLRFFAGLSTEQTALALGVSERTVIREWAYARTWLAAEVATTEPPEAGNP